VLATAARPPTLLTPRSAGPARTQHWCVARRYPHIRLFTVGQKTSAKTPLSDLATIEQNWTVASHTSVAQGGRFGLFSAVCWIFGPCLLDAARATAAPPLRGGVGTDRGCLRGANQAAQGVHVMMPSG